MISAVILATYSYLFTNTAVIDNYSHQKDTINGYIDNWIHNYHDSAKLLSIQVGDLETSVSATSSHNSIGEPNVKLDMKTWDDLEKVYPYFNNLKQFQHVSFVSRSEVGILARDNSNPGI